MNEWDEREPNAFGLDELDYELPAERIAQVPLGEREAARLMSIDLRDGKRAHHHVRDLPGLIAPSLLVLNDTRVIPARLFANKPSGGRVELLLLERLSAPGTDERWLSLGRASKRLRAGQRLHAPGLELTVQARRANGELELRLVADEPIEQVVARTGVTPLPPYIQRAPTSDDAARYQTVYAQRPGAVAAPTAGLHLSERLLQALGEHGHEIAYVTLHVGPGTFAPVRGALHEHRMHQERFEVPVETARAVAAAKAEGRPVLAVGTTVVRALESAASDAGGVEAHKGRTALFIRPPYRFRVVDALLTNFHLPRSTLLALVMAFAGRELVRDCYATAIEAGYRFFSYGDAMLLHEPP